MAGCRSGTGNYIASLPAEYFPNMVALAGEFAFADADERFELLIDIFVDGLARRLDREGNQTRLA